MTGGRAGGPQSLASARFPRVPGEGCVLTLIRHALPSVAPSAWPAKGPAEPATAEPAVSVAG
jgi:hypothetical protein